jgi:hypothetical protein
MDRCRRVSSLEDSAGGSCVICTIEGLAPPRPRVRNATESWKYLDMGNLGVPRRPAAR